MDVEDARILCETEADRKSFEYDRVSSVVDRVGTTSVHDEETIQERLMELADASQSGKSPQQLLAEYAPQIDALEAYMQGNTMKVVDNTSK